MQLPTLIFDIETVTDLKAGAHLFNLDLSADDTKAALDKLRRQETGHDFQRIALHEIVCISGLWIDENGLKLFSFSRERYSEAEILAKFVSIFEKRQPILVSWNGAQFDLPVILFRAMYHGVSAPSLFDQGELNTQKRYNNYQNRYHHRHIDVMDVMAMFNGRHFQKLNDISCLLGFPGKQQVDIQEQVRQQDWASVACYCETDVLNTWLIYLRWLLLKGQVSAQVHEQWIYATINYLQQQPQQAAFLNAWQLSSQHTSLTEHYFTSM